ncbi:MAG: threonine aldolase [Bacteroidetes bacterium GWF2_38_335]|nr:MAG: threonine aldolase [Bacteroidetes bacterium GWF2_38_335]OFY78042.1 MAG: threonine aldolase [Bacteroidetes bacterium RIFOXYA12_FULL_38_20]HBS88314.1 threonine aldolase [Bacteroidales bacterium]
MKSEGKTIIDLRSDTVTLPTKAMMDCILNAKVGDDVFEEDPTVIELQEFAADMFGMEAAIFCPSGTMTNQIAIKLHTRPGDEVICDQLYHVYRYEGGGIGFNSSCSVKLINGERGLFKAEDVMASLNNPEDVHNPLSRLVVIENTCNKGGGSVWNFNDLVPIKDVCNKNNLKFHLDGARLFNALAVTGESPEKYGKLFDTISICLSKGLGTPVGSLLLGNKADIKQARRIRKVMGGGMRQAGFLAAAGLFALKNNVARLKDDHLRAKKLGAAVAERPWCEYVLPVETNIVVFKLKDISTQTEMMNRFEAAGLRMVPFGPGLIRMVTHLGIDDSMVERAGEIICGI